MCIAALTAAAAQDQTFRIPGSLRGCGMTAFSFDEFDAAEAGRLLGEALASSAGSGYTIELAPRVQPRW
jgi:hypothetical protein